MTTPDRIHGGLVESTLEAVQTWLRLAAASVKMVALAKDRERPGVEAEFHDAAVHRYEQTAIHAERFAEACRIQARYYASLAKICRSEATPASDGR